MLDDILTQAGDLDPQWSSTNFHDNGVSCAVHGCSHNKKRDRQFAYFPFPSVKKNQGKQTEKLSRMRRKKWIANISRVDLSEKKVLYSFYIR